MGKSLITDEYRELNKKFHERERNAGTPWGVSGRKYYKQVYNFANKIGAKSILDYGCGSSTLKGAFYGHGTLDDFDFREYDPCVPGKDAKRPDKADLVVNTDVMEHVEPQFINDTLLELYNRSEKGLFMVIATISSSEWLTSEINAHRTVENADWWINRIQSLGIRIDEVFVDRKKVYIWIRKPKAKDWDGYQPETKRRTWSDGGKI